MALLFPVIPLSWGLPDREAMACGAGEGLSLPGKPGIVIQPSSGYPYNFKQKTCPMLSATIDRICMRRMQLPCERKPAVCLCAPACAQGWLATDRVVLVPFVLRVCPDRCVSASLR